MSDEVQQLRARVAELEAENRALRNPVKPRWPASAFKMPSDSELVALRSIVVASHPFLAAVGQADFDCAFYAVGCLPRRRDSALDLGLHWSIFTGRAEDALRARGVSPIEVRLAAFVSATLAHGDVAHSVTQRYPHDLNFSYGNHYGVLPVDSWRNVISSAKTLAPAELPPSYTAAPRSPSQLLVVAPGRAARDLGAV
jgi:hypothetical protein